MSLIVGEGRVDGRSVREQTRSARPGDRSHPSYQPGSEGALATDINTTSDDRIGGYRYIRTIHPGATSVVMEVLQEGTQRRFALKQLLASRAEDRDEYKAFMHEAKLGMELRHPNLIRVIEFVKDRSQPYFVMELFTGLSPQAADRPAVDLSDAQNALAPDHRASRRRHLRTCMIRVGCTATSSPRTSCSTGRAKSG